jgi:inner membrane protein
MDSITQGLLGAAAAQVVLGRRLGARTWLYGAVGGMAADLDIFLRSSTDPTVAWIYHRHFTHSLAFIPIGGPIAALPWISRRRHRAHWRAIVAATTVGYATHALLDAFTTYGTMLLWPFSDVRIAWGFVAIIDLLFSVPLGWGVVRSARRNTRRPAAIALAWCAAYLGFGGVQHARAVSAARTLAQERGHVPRRVIAVPAAFTNFVWRTAYEANGRIFVDQARTPWWTATRVRDGDSIARVTLEDLSPTVRQDAELRRAFEVFAWFADGWVAHDPRGPLTFGDLRYGQELASVTSMWGLHLEPDAPAGQRVQGMQRAGDDPGPRMGRLWRVVLGDPELAP